MKVELKNDVFVFQVFYIHVFFLDGYELHACVLTVKHIHNDNKTVYCGEL